MKSQKKESKNQSSDYLYFQLEKSRMRRENAMLVLNKSFVFYFVYLIVGVLGFINNYVSKDLLNLLVVLGLSVLFIGSIPFVRTMREEEKTITEIMESLKNK